jgi:DNA polymerase-3 subunit epsilon
LQEYLLFIDTEASGLPKKWFLPYSEPGNWPNAVQVSWVIYNRSGEKVAEQNHYINNNDFEILATALRIHGLSKNFLLQNGIPRATVLEMLTNDLQQYQPMIVGHFLELDYHIIGAEYWRIGLDNALEGLPAFCIMKASKHLQKNPTIKYLRLGDLFNLLFKMPLTGQHNALTDASATADCFFELVKRNEIRSFDQPPIQFQEEEKMSDLFGWIIVFLVIIFSALLIGIYYG